MCAEMSVYKLRMLVVDQKELSYLDILKYIGGLIACNQRYTYSTSINPSDGSVYTDITWKSNIIDYPRHAISVLRRVQGDHFFIVTPSWIDALDVRDEQLN